jgi:PAS domain S-box-containing protein
VEPTAQLAQRQREGTRRIAQMALVACAVSTPFVVGIVFLLERGLGLGLLAFIAVLSAYEGTVLWLLRTERYPSWMDWVSAGVEVSAPALIAILDDHRIGPAYALTSAPGMLYGLVVVITALRLKPRLVLFAGALGAAEMLALVVVLRPRIGDALVNELPSLTLSNLVQRAAYIFLAGVAGYWLSRSLMRLVEAVAAQAAARTAADRALKQREEEYRALAEHSSDVIVRCDRAGRVLFVNPAVRELGTRAPVEAFAGRPLDETDLPVPVRQAIGHALQEVVRTGRASEAEIAFTGPGGESWLDARFVPEAGPGEQVASVLATLRNVTARKLAERQGRALEEELRQAQKMEAIGRLAGGVAHDFNNVLTVILGCTEALLAESAPDVPQRADLEDIRHASLRAAALTRQLLAFSRKQPMAPRVVDLAQLVSDARGMLARLIGEDVEMRILGARETVCVVADPDQIEVVLMNLAANARDAMPGGGILTVDLGETEIATGSPELAKGLKPGRHAVLAVTDTGCGITPETMEHLFEPFFTTKERGRGTGLGLSSAYGIVRRSGGLILVRSEKGQGSTFRVLLPRVEGAPTLAAKPRPTAQTRGATVLVVEDEEGVRATVLRVLRGAGYDVLSASGGAEGVKVCQGYLGPIDLLLTDVVMPGMSGRAVWETLAGQRPELRVLFMSGYTDDVLGAQGMLAPGTPLLQKPFTSEGLLAKVSALLADPVPPRPTQREAVGS